MGTLGSLDTQTGVGEFASISMHIEGVEITSWRSYSFNSHYLTPCDNWHFDVGDEELNPSLRKLLVPGNKVELFIDGVKQCSGYIDVVDSAGDRNSGLVLHIEGRDMLAPLVDSQIDPKKKFPEKTKLTKLILSTVENFGFETVDFATDVDLKLGKKGTIKHRKKKPGKFLADFPVPKKKPQHNDTYYQFISRIVQRYGLWLTTTVDGDGLIIAGPDYDQDPRYQARWRRDGTDNNIKGGGIRQDGTEQPTFILARGDIPGRQQEHQRMAVVVGNPFSAIFGLQESSIKAGNNPLADKTFPLNVTEQQIDRLRNNQQAKDLIEILHRFNIDVGVGSNSYTTLIDSQPVKVANRFATKISRPRFLKDMDSHTRTELEGFAKRQMSLCTRKAFVAHYDFMGHTIDGLIPQVDTIISVIDEAADFEGLLWILSRTFNCSRNGGLTTSIEAIPLDSIQF